MNPAAQVHSLDRLEQLHAALARFGVDAEAALGAAALELLRVRKALEERLDHWQRQVYRRQEEVAQARADLSFARAVHEGQSIGCVEQELALRKALGRLREAEAKVVTVRRWQRELPEVAKEYEGPARRLAGFVEADLRQALAFLQGRIAALQAYVAIAAPADAPAASPAPAPPPSPETTEPS